MENIATRLQQELAKIPCHSKFVIPEGYNLELESIEFPYSCCCNVAHSRLWCLQPALVDIMEETLR